MIAPQESEIWRIIPPEEKFIMMARAQANGTLAVIMNIMALSGIAIGLKLNWLLWVAIAISPVVFQFVAGKEWRKLKPRIMLEYLAARSAARRFAFTCNSKDLSISMLFRGVLHEEIDINQYEDELEAISRMNEEAEVWITLLNDAVVVMTEGYGGAQLRFAQLINDKMVIETSTPKDYAKTKELQVAFKDKDGHLRRYRLSSQCQAALVVFERRFSRIKEEARKAGEAQLAPPVASKTKERTSFLLSD
jgi:hypothetical protein